MPYREYFPKENPVSETVIIRNARTSGARYIPGCCVPDGIGGQILQPGDEMAVLKDKAYKLVGDGIVELDEDGKPVDIIGRKALRQEQARLASRAAKSVNAHK